LSRFCKLKNAWGGTKRKVDNRLREEAKQLVLLGLPGSRFWDAKEKTKAIKGELKAKKKFQDSEIFCLPDILNGRLCSGWNTTRTGRDMSGERQPP